MYKPDGGKWKHVFFFEEKDHIGEPMSGTHGN